MVKIRLKRLGAKKRPYYRLVVADARSPRDGRFIEELGTYDPIAKPAAVRIDEERVREWIRRGAQPSDTARSLLERQGILPRTGRRSHSTTVDDATASSPSTIPATTPQAAPVAVTEPEAATETEAAAEPDAPVALVETEPPAEEA